MKECCVVNVFLYPGISVAAIVVEGLGMFSWFFEMSRSLVSLIEVAEEAL